MMSSKQRTFGQFETPANVADLLLGFCLRRPSDRLLDPSCGRGAFLQRVACWQQWLADRPADVSADGLSGVELDPVMAQAAQERLPGARILRRNFFTLEPDSNRPFDAVIGNPPYTRAEWFGRLHRESAQQLTLDIQDPLPEGAEERKEHLLPRELWAQLDGRSGLHAFFLLHSHRFLREGGRLGFVVPNGWLDVAYGQKLKQFLLDHYRIIALIESGVERWFQDAKINTCLVVLEKCDGPNRRAANLTRLIRLKRSLAELMPYDLDNRVRPAFVDQLVTRLMPSQERRTEDYTVRVLPQKELAAGSKWGSVLRAPTVYRQRLKNHDIPPLGSWAKLKRGFTTGANGFFYLQAGAIERWGIEAEFRKPVLKSLRGIRDLRLTSSSSQQQILSIPTTSDLENDGSPGVSGYVGWGESQGYHLRRTCAGRQPWYGLPDQQRAHLVLPKGIWQRHFAPLLDDPLPIDQQLYGISLPPDVSPMAAAALLNSAWFALQCELQGRVNFGEGVLWLATYEANGIRLPDPRLLPATERAALELSFVALAQRPIGNVEIELGRPDRQALDDAVFDAMGFSAVERSAVIDALVERVGARLLRARTAR